MSQSDRYTVQPVDNSDRNGAWAVRDDDTWTIESRHMFRGDAVARAKAKNEGKNRA